jgi:hypothetical protein
VSSFNIGARVAYVDEWGPGPYHGTVTYHCDGVYHVDWDGNEGPIMVQRADRLSLLNSDEGAALSKHRTYYGEQFAISVIDGRVCIAVDREAATQYENGPFVAIVDLSPKEVDGVMTFLGQEFG